jgi:hypothetical protein
MYNQTRMASSSQALHVRNKRLNQRRVSPVADVIKERATRTDVKFDDIMQMDLLLFFMSAILGSEYGRWYPQTFVYANSLTQFPFFQRASQHRHFEKLKIVLGLKSREEVLLKATEGFSKFEIRNWSDFAFSRITFQEALNLENLDKFK